MSRRATHRPGTRARAAADARTTRPGGGVSRYALLLIATFWLAACGTSPEQDLPRVDEMTPTYRPPVPPQPAPDQQAAPRIFASIQRLDIPLRHPTDPIWAQVDEQSVPMLTRAVWHRNGMRVGTLSHARWAAFADALPATFGVQRAALSPTALPVAVRTSPRLGAPIQVDLTVPPRTVREAVARGGRIKLLAKLSARPGGPAYIELTPHHYVPGNNLPRVVRDGDSFKVIPRTSEEKALDGRTYDDLKLSVELPPGQMLVVGLYWPWSDPRVVNYAQEMIEAEASAERVDREATDAGVIEPQIDAVDDLPDYAPPPPIQQHLGRALFTGARMGQPLQMLLVIEVE